MAGRYNGFFLALVISTGTVQAVRFENGDYGVRQGTIELNPALSFDTIGNLTTCESATIKWFYAGPPTDMTLSVTNVGVLQVPLLPAPSTTTTTSPTPPPMENDPDRRAVPLVDMVITFKVNPSLLTFRWPTVNITSGTYKLQAAIIAEDFLQESADFHVLQGPNTACLSSASPSPSTGTNSPPAETSAGSWVPGPVGGSSSNPINTGAIIGIILGVVALTIAGVGAFFIVRNRRRKKQSGVVGGGKKWNHLDSTDSRGDLMDSVAMAGAQDRRSRQLSSSHRRANYSNSSSIGGTTKGSQDDIAEKEMGSAGYASRKTSVASYDSNAMALSTLPSLHHDVRNPNYGYEHNDIPSPTRRKKPSYPDAEAAYAAVQRRSSDARHRSQPYLPTIESTSNSVSNRSSLEGTAFTHTTSEIPTPSSPSPLNPDAKRSNRQSFGRKRKPVPAYDPSSVPNSPSPMPSSSFPSSPSPFGSDSYHSHEMGVLHQPQARNPSPGPVGAVGGGHYTTRTAAGNGISRPGTSDGAELLHKSSLGIEGKPVHYLMPDLPADAENR